MPLAAPAHILTVREGRRFQMTQARADLSRPVFDRATRRRLSAQQLY